MNLQPPDARAHARQTLTPHQYAIWNQHHNHGHSTRHIAAANHTTRHAVINTLRRANKRLQP